MDNTDLRKAGLKVTLPRVKILQHLEAAEAKHMSAEEIYRNLMDAGEDVGLATVYRVLTQFEQAGIVERHNFEGGSAVFDVGAGSARCLPRSPTTAARSAARRSRSN